MQPQASTIKTLHVVVEFSLVEYDMWSCLLFFYIAYTQPGCFSDGRFEDFPGEFDGFYASVPPVKDRYGEPEGGGSEWEPIKILLEGDGNSYKMNTASNTRLRLTSQVG
jgi:hypothetical protein